MSGILLKSELCTKHPKFPTQVCLDALNNVPYVYLLTFALFSRYIVYAKKHIFVNCHVSEQPQRCSFHFKYSKMSISCKVQAT